MRTRTLLLPLALAVPVAVLVPHNADAQFSTDGALLAQMIAQEQQAVSQLEQILTALKGQTQLLTMVMTGEPLQEVAEALGLLQTAYTGYQVILGDIQSLGYSLSNVNLSFAATFPSAGYYQANAQATYPTVELGWSNEILASAQIADRAQTDITETAELTDAANNLIQASGSAAGEQAELQIMVQMLGVVGAQLTILSQNLTTTGRVVVDQAAIYASEREMSFERRRRNRLNYVAVGVTITPPNEMP